MRIRFLLSVVGALLVMMVGREVYRWVAYREERSEFVHMRERLIDAGAAVMETRSASETLRAEVEAGDARLKSERAVVQRYTRYARHGALPAHLFGGYREALDRYNQQVSERNRKVGEWQTIIARNHAAVDRFNALADSMRTAAAAMGDPYYAVPSPLQAAAERKGARAANP